MKLTTKYDLGESVHVPAMGQDGKVISINLNGSGMQYEVRSINRDGAPISVFYYDDEICKRKKKSQIGFHTTSS